MIPRIGRIEARLVGGVSIGLLLFSVVAAYVTYTSSYRYQLEQAELLQKQLVLTVQAQAEVAAFAANQEIAQGVVEGLLANPVISGVRLRTTVGFLYERGFDSSATVGRSRTYVLLSPVDRVEHIGTLEVRQNDAQVDIAAQERARYHVVLMLSQLVFAVILVFAVARVLITRPVIRLARGLVEIQPGSRVRLTIDNKHLNDEIGLLITSANALLDAAENAVAVVQKQRDQMEVMATHDHLTGLPIQRLADDRFRVAVSYATRAKASIALLFIDLDAFKAVNDDFGHEAGDVVLKAVAQRLSDNLRDADTAARVGGDEFLVILSGIESEHAAIAVAEKLVSLIAQPVEFDGQSLQVGASIGIALFPQHGQTMESLRLLADAAMYQVKRTGKNGVCLAGSARTL